MELTLPLVKVEAQTLAEGWEKAVLACWEQGARIPTQYDQEKDPNSRDISLALAVVNPWANRRIHRAMPGGLDDLENYVALVLFGGYDHWIDPEAGKWQYTYHERLAAFQVPGLEEPIDQLAYVLKVLAEAPHTRRAQAVTWKAWEDAGIEYPACLQRLWFRVFDDELVMNIHIRSNDAFKAAFMNMYAFTELQALVAHRLSEQLGREVKAGQYNHIADSFHIYGKDFDDFQKFLETLEKRTFAERTWTPAEIGEQLNEAREREIEHLWKEVGKLAEADSEQAELLSDRIGSLLRWWSVDHPWLVYKIDEEE